MIRSSRSCCSPSSEIWSSWRVPTEGERKGRLAGQKQSVADLCEVLGIELTPVRLAIVEKMDEDQLAALRTYLKTRRSWPGP